MSLNKAHEGYDYQDLITSYFVLREILDGNLESIFSVDKKNTIGNVPDRFDDLVITNGSDIQRKQIKYSNETTSKTLIKDYLSSDSHYSIALHKLFETWKALKTPDTEFRLCLAWNEPTNDDITRVLNLQSDNSSFPDFPTKVFKVNIDHIWSQSPESFNRWDSLGNYVKEHNIDRNDFRDFCNSLLIEVCFPKASLKFNEPSDLELILIAQAQRLGIGKYPNDNVYVSDFLERLAKLAGTYRTNSNQISAKDILSELRVRTDFGSINQKFEIDKSKNIVSYESNVLFHNQIVSNKKTLLLGEPGAGKSWFLTNFIDFLRARDCAVIRHYCFTSTEDPYSSQRVSSDVFFGNLISDIERYFPHIKKGKNYLYASNLNELNLVLSLIETPIVIVVDGLDHINRILQSSATLSKEKTRIVEYISKIELPSHVCIVLGSQPTADLEDLTEVFSFVKVNLPKWNIEDTKKLMNNFGVEYSNLDDKDLPELLHEKSEGSPLYLTYILKTLSNSHSITKDLINSLPKYDFNLESYYEYLTSQIFNNTTSEILSCLDFSVSKKELKEIIPMKHHFDADIRVLSPVLSENSSRGGVKLYHDSFRRFNIDRLSSIANINDIYSFIITWLSNNGFYSNDKSYRYLLNYFIISERYEEAIKYADYDFLAKSLYYGHSETLIKNNCKKFFHIAEKSQNWPLFTYAGELHRAIITTCSEENHSQFLDNFDLYFEAICAIYGVEKANALLFFNGEKNFSDRHTAKGFETLQRYGYSPCWEEVNGLFERNLALEDFKYFVCYKIQENVELNEIFTSLLTENYFDYLRVFIVELYKAKGFDVVSAYYQDISDVDQSIAVEINSALDSVMSDKRLLIGNKAQISGLQPLDLNFIKDYIKEDELHQFYSNVEKYSQVDANKLMEFEKTIPSVNFFYNWLKYFIRLMLIENRFSCAENQIVENLKFLASDTDPYKGIPRAIDFTYSNGSLLNKTIKNSLVHIKSHEAWGEVVAALIKLPHPILSIIENDFLSENNILHVIEAYESLGKSEDEDYINYAGYSFRKAIYYGKIGKIDKAKEELQNALKFTTSYTYRKDTTLSEIIDPLPAIKRVNSDFAIQSAKNLKYLTDAVIKHTEDGKDTRWLTISWFEKLLEIDYKLASTYLVNELLTNEYFWKLDYMFIDYLNNSKNVEPVILNFLYKLSPTNNRDNYLDSFLDVISNLMNIDVNLARISLTNLSARNWNDSYNSLSKATEEKFAVLNDQLGLSNNFYVESKKERLNSYLFNKEKLADVLERVICKKSSLSLMSESELIDYLAKKDRLDDDDLNFIYFYVQEKNVEKFSIDLLVSIIRKEFSSDTDERYKKVRVLTKRLPLAVDSKIFIFVQNFVYSKDGWFSSFIDKESLKEAVEIDRDRSLSELAKALCEIFTNSSSLYKYTANLIAAFEFSGLNGEVILAMYESSFNFIKNRLPDVTHFEWGSIDSSDVLGMNDDEAAIVFLLAKSKNLDAFVQRDIIYSIGYIMNYDQSLLINPLKWFFNNVEKFEQLFVASLLDLILIEIDNIPLLVCSIKSCFSLAVYSENFYIQNSIRHIVNGCSHE